MVLCLLWWGCAGQQMASEGGLLTPAQDVGYSLGLPQTPWEH